MFDLKKSLGKTIEIELEKKGVEAQTIVAIIGSVTIASNYARLRFLTPVEVIGDELFGLPHYCVLQGKNVLIPVVKNEGDEDERTISAGGTIVAIY